MGRGEAALDGAQREIGQRQFATSGDPDLHGQKQRQRQPSAPAEKQERTRAAPAQRKERDLLDRHEGSGGR